MSGGSFNYFCWEASEKLSAQATTVDEMADHCDYLASKSPDDLAKENVERESMLDVSTHLRAISTRLRAMSRLMGRWEEVFQAVEWQNSGDWGPKDITDAFEKLRRGDG